MSGTVRLNTPSYLPTLIGPGLAGASLLSSLYRYSEQPPETVDPIAALEQARAGEAQQVALVAAEPRVRNAIAQFIQALVAAKTPGQLLANLPALKVLLIANGLEDQVGNSTLARQALLADPSNANSSVNQLSDTRWLRVNLAFSFATKGLSVLYDPKSIKAITNGYAGVLWRKGLDETTHGISNALDFLRHASTITSVGQVTGDPTFRAVIMTVLGVPQESTPQTPAAREQAISSRIALTKFQDPAFVTQFTHRYLIMMAQAASQGIGTAWPGAATSAAHSAGLVV
jgi:hypothetical protein